MLDALSLAFVIFSSQILLVVSAAVAVLIHSCGWVCAENFVPGEKSTENDNDADDGYCYAFHNLMPLRKVVRARIGGERFHRVERFVVIGDRL